MSALVLIDGSNFYHMLRSRYQVLPLNLDWTKVSDVIRRRLPSSSKSSSEIEIRYCVGAISRGDEPASYDRQQELFDVLRNAGVQVWTGRLATRSREVKCVYCRTRFAPAIQCPKCGKLVPSEIKVEKGVDVKIAADAVQAAATGSHNTIVIASQDGDFLPVADAVRSLRGRFFCLSTPVPTADKNAGRVPAILRNHESVIWMTRKFLADCGVKGDAK